MEAFTLFYFAFYSELTSPIVSALKIISSPSLTVKKPAKHHHYCQPAVWVIHLEINSEGDLSLKHGAGEDDGSIPG